VPRIPRGDEVVVVGEATGVKQARRGDIELKQAVGDLLLRTLEGAWRGPGSLGAGFACVRAKGAEAGAGRVGSSAVRVEVPLPVCYTHAAHGGSVSKRV
jgi:hypothetical protein